MSSVSRREVTTVRVEFTVPARYPHGACWIEVFKAISAARLELTEAGRIPREAEAPDDMIRVLPVDDAVIIYYDKPERAVGETGATP